MFNDLIMDVEKAKETDNDALSLAYSTDEEIIDMFYDASMNDLKIDVVTVLGIEFDSTTLEDFYSAYTPVFELLIRFKQLSYFYYQQNDVSGKMKERYNHYVKLYEKTLAKVGRFRAVEEPIYTDNKGFMRF